MGKVEREDDRSHLATEPEMSLPKIAVTMGDPAGIGPEVCLHLLQNKEVAAPMLTTAQVENRRIRNGCHKHPPKRPFLTHILGQFEFDLPFNETKFQ